MPPPYGVSVRGVGERVSLPVLGEQSNTDKRPAQIIKLLTSIKIGLILAPPSHIEGAA